VAALGYAAGIPRELHRPSATAVEAPVQAENEGLRVVLFRALDGERRAIAMSAVEQVERAHYSAVRRPGEAAQIVMGEDILPLAGVSEGAELPEHLTVLRLAADGQCIAYAAREVLEIASMTGRLKRIEGQTALAGVTLIEGAPAEVVDCHALFARHGATSGKGLTCRLVGDDGWMRNFLAPIVEAAGYRIVSGDEDADVAFVDLAAGEDQVAAARKAIRLRAEIEAIGGADSIYRYDRAALMSALLRAGEELAA
jgi:two-component system chemotaxis sensor kinase CheA